MRAGLCSRSHSDDGFERVLHVRADDDKLGSAVLSSHVLVVCCNLKLARELPGLQIRRRGAVDQSILRLPFGP